MRLTLTYSLFVTNSFLYPIQMLFIICDKYLLDPLFPEHPLDETMDDCHYKLHFLKGLSCMRRESVKSLGILFIA